MEKHFWFRFQTFSKTYSIPDVNYNVMRYNIHVSNSTNNPFHHSHYCYSYTINNNFLSRFTNDNFTLISKNYLILFCNWEEIHMLLSKVRIHVYNAKVIEIMGRINSKKIIQNCWIESLLNDLLPFLQQLQLDASRTGQTRLN